MVHLKEKYTHYKNSKEYIPTSLCKIQDSGFWVDAVMYHPIGEPDAIFVRNVVEFEEKFKVDEVKPAVEKTRKELKDIFDKLLLKFPVPPTNSSIKYTVFDVLIELEAINKELSRIKEGV